MKFVTFDEPALKDLQRIKSLEAEAAEIEKKVDTLAKQVAAQPQ